MTDTQTLVPARQLAETNKARFPNESTEYRAARNALLVEEIELRRHIERVASERRALPLGGRLPQDFELTIFRRDLSSWFRLRRAIPSTRGQ